MKKSLILAAALAALGTIGVLRAAQPTTPAPAACCDGGACCNGGACCVAK